MTEGLSETSCARQGTWQPLPEFHTQKRKAQKKEKERVMGIPLVWGKLSRFERKVENHPWMLVLGKKQSIT